MGFTGSSDNKESASKPGDPGSVPASARSPGEGNGYPLQYSCLKNSLDRGAWQATVHGVSELDTAEQLTHKSSCSFTFFFLNFWVCSSVVGIEWYLV